MSLKTRQNRKALPYYIAGCSYAYMKSSKDNWDSLAVAAREA